MSVYCVPGNAAYPPWRHGVETLSHGVRRDTNFCLHPVSGLLMGLLVCLLAPLDVKQTRLMDLSDI